MRTVSIPLIVAILALLLPWPCLAVDYDAAVRTVRASYESETWEPESESIRKVEFFPASERKFLIVTFRRRGGGSSKPYIYEGFPEALWREWKAAPSAGRWYNANLKGNRAFFYSE